MTPVTGASPAVCACAVNANAARQRVASLATAAPQLLERDELVAFRANAVDELLQRRDADLGADQRRMPEKRGPCIAHHLVQARHLEHVVDMLRLAAVAGKGDIAEIFRPDIEAVI